MSISPEAVTELQRRRFCLCGHVRFLHHHNLGCLARTDRTRSGVSLCDCQEFDEVPGQEDYR